MTIKSDKWIRRMAEQHGLIEPFEPGQIRQAADGSRVISYGTSSYGYDIRCEAVAEKGVVSLSDQNVIDVRTGFRASNSVTRDHNDRFWGAFVTEVQEWISAVARGEHTGSTAWDGYAAASVCDAGVRALTEDGEVAVQMIERPVFYA